MARLTQAKMERWEKDLEKALSLARKVLQQAVEQQASSAGGRWSDVTDVAGAARASVHALEGAVGRVEMLIAGEARRKP